MSVRMVRKDTASKPCSLSRCGRCYKRVSVLMMPVLGWLPALHLTSSSCVAASIQHYRHKNGPLSSVRIVRKDTASKPCSLFRCGRCYKRVSVLMMPVLGWPPAPHLTSSSCVAASIQHLECKNGLLMLVRIVRKDIASKPLCHYRW